MKITDVRVFPVDEEQVKAYVTITLEGCLVIRDLKVIKGNERLFVAMPSKKRKDGTYRDTIHPIDQKTRKFLTKRVLNEYQLAVRNV